MSTSNEIAVKFNGNEKRKRKLPDMIGPQWSSCQAKNCEKAVKMIEYVADVEASVDTEKILEIRSGRYMPKLPELKMQLSNDNRFPAKVKIRSSLQVVKRIRACLSDHEKRVFRSYTQLGHFIDFPFPWEFLGSLANYLALRKLESSKENEAWFSVEGKALRFSLAEFALVSGMNTGSYPSDEEISKRTMHHVLIEKYFNGQEKITVKELEKKFVEMRSDQPGGDKIKIAFVYLLSGFLAARDPRRFINPLYFQLADDLSIFNMYPWGRVCYNLTLKHLNTEMKHKWEERSNLGKSTKENLHLCGCPHLFQVWAFEAIPRLGELFGNRSNRDQVPRFLLWKTRSVNKNSLYKIIKESMQDPELIVYPILTPSEEERLHHSNNGIFTFSDSVDHLAEQRLAMSLSDPPCHGEDSETPTLDTRAFQVKHKRGGGKGSTTICDGVAPSLLEDVRLPREAAEAFHVEPQERVGLGEEREQTSQHDLGGAGTVDELKSYVDSRLEVARCWHEEMMRRMEREEDLARRRHHEVMARMDYIVEHLVRGGG